MKTRLNIDRIVLRTRGLTPTAARALASSIAPALAQGLNADTKPAAIPQLQVTLPASAIHSPAAVSQQLATQLGAASRASA